MPHSLFAPLFPLSNIIIGVLGAVAYPRFPAFWALARAALTLKRGVLTPGLPHAYPIPGGAYPDMASGMWGVSLSCLRELFDGLYITGQTYT